MRAMRRLPSVASFAVSLAAAAVVVTAGCGDGELPIPDTCNGRVELCERRYDQVAYATTHNAMSNFDEGWMYPNQTHGIGWQLEDGVRGLMLDAWPYDGKLYLCHFACELGKIELDDGLREIREFLDRKRGEVVTIIFESYITAAEMETAFQESGLDRYVRVQPVGTAWPTLRELIDANQRLVVFTDVEGGARPWYHDVWAFAWETHYSFKTPEELSCAPNRGNTANSLFIFNHFLTDTLGGAPELAEMINHDPLLAERVAQCQTESGGRLPNFVTLDYYEIGDLFSVVNDLNGVSTP
jgi:hypothetical protein